MTLTIQIFDVLLTLAVVVIVTRTFENEDRANRAHGRILRDTERASLSLRHTSIGTTITGHADRLLNEGHAVGPYGGAFQLLTCMESAARGALDSSRPRSFRRCLKVGLPAVDGLMSGGLIAGLQELGWEGGRRENQPDRCNRNRRSGARELFNVE